MTVSSNEFYIPVETPTHVTLHKNLYNTSCSDIFTTKILNILNISYNKENSRQNITEQNRLTVRNLMLNNRLTALSPH